jgi:hypothetical protein
MMKKFPGTKCGISWFISLLKACKRNEDKWIEAFEKFENL